MTNHDSAGAPAAEVREWGCSQSYEELVALIYQGPLDEQPWKTFLQRLRSHLGSDVAAMTLRHFSGDLPQLVIWESDGQGDDAEAVRGSRLRLCDLDPLGKALTRSGDVRILDEVIAREDLVKTSFYTELMQPFGIEYQLGILVSEPSGWKCGMGLMNGPSNRNFDAADKACLQRLIPHLERALKTYAKLEQARSREMVLADTLERMSIGTVILDGTGAIMEASRMVEDIPQLLVTRGRLALSSSLANAQFQKLVKEALAHRNRNAATSFIDALRVEGGDSDLGLLVRSVECSEQTRGDVYPAVIIYVSEAATRRLASDQLVARIFGLSPTEARLAMHLANGMSLAEAAAALGLAESSVRTYTKYVFAKLGVSRQADLVRLVLNSVALLA